MMINWDVLFCLIIPWILFIGTCYLVKYLVSGMNKLVTIATILFIITSTGFIIFFAFQEAPKPHPDMGATMILNNADDFIPPTKEEIEAANQAALEESEKNIEKGVIKEQEKSKERFENGINN